MMKIPIDLIKLNGSFAGIYSPDIPGSYETLQQTLDRAVENEDISKAERNTIIGLMNLRKRAYEVVRKIPGIEERDETITVPLMDRIKRQVKINFEK